MFELSYEKSENKTKQKNKKEAELWAAKKQELLLWFPIIIKEQWRQKQKEKTKNCVFQQQVSWSNTSGTVF